MTYLSKTCKLILLAMISLSLSELWGTNITSVNYDAETNIVTITFSDSINTDSIRFDRLFFDDDDGGLAADVIFTGGSILTGDTYTDSLKISLIYGGIIDHWTGYDGRVRYIWGNDVSLVNAVEGLDLSSLTLIVGEGAFIDNNAEPFVDTDNNGVYSPTEDFTDVNGNGNWDPAEEYIDSNGNGIWDEAEYYIDVNGNNVYDPPEDFTDSDSNGVRDDAELLFEDANGNGVWDETEFYIDANGDGVWNPAEDFIDINGDGVWFPGEDYIDENGNEIWDAAEFLIDMDGNGIWDSSEVYVDVNLNGIWDPAEKFEDLNNNGVRDSAEVFIDADSNGVWFPGEEFIDLFHFNGIWDPGEEFSDVDNNGVWDAAEDFSDLNGNGIWDPGESFIDGNGNGQWDPAEDFTDTGYNGVWDPGEEYIDSNGNGVYDPPEEFFDTNNNGRWDPAEVFIDANGDSLWNPAEPWTDTNGNNIWDDAESFTDTNGNGVWDRAEPLTDINYNNIWDDAEDFTDTNGNGAWDPAEYLEDLDGNGVWDFAEEVGDAFTIGDGDGVWDPPEPFEDTNGNGVWDFEDFNDIGFGFPPAGANNGVWDFEDYNGNGICDTWFGPNAECEPWTDENNNGICDREVFDDLNDNGVWDPGENFIDRNGNGEWDPAEDFVDADGDGLWFPGEDFVDYNYNGVRDDAETFTDSNGNGIWDPAENFVDTDGDLVHDSVAEEFTDINNNGVWDAFNPISDTTVGVPVSGTDVYPGLIDAEYDANINRVMLIFDRPVQFDQIPEDESFMNGPGSGWLEAGEDRNGNGVLDLEANIIGSRIGFSNSAGHNMNLEGFDRVIQTVDNDTMQIILTRDDGKRLETILGLSSLSLNMSAGAFVDTLYNPSAISNLPVTVIEDSIPLIADSAVYNASENKLSVFFRSNAVEHRELLADPAPIYSKFSFSKGNSKVTLSGIVGVPIVSDDMLQFKLKLIDQKALETMIDDMGDENILSLSIEEYAVYDENNNGNLEVINLPIAVTETEAEPYQPPRIISTGLVYDAYTDVLTLPWNMRVGFFNTVAIPQADDVVGSSALEGIALFDPIDNNLLTLSRGEVYFPILPDTTCIRLDEEDARYLENYPNRDSLLLVLEPYTFFSAIPFGNGNKSVNADSSFVINYRWDRTAPSVTEVFFNTEDSTLTVTLNELVNVALLYPEKLSFGGIDINGDLVVDNADQYVSIFSVKVVPSIYDNIMNLDDSVKINPRFQSVAGAFVNLDGAVSGWLDQEANFGRYFWIKSFEAFAPPPENRFAALRSVGVNCDIYVDNEVWETKIDAEDLDVIVTAFDSIAPNSANQGIADIVREFIGHSEEDTDNNGKVIFVFTDIPDEYGKGRNNTKSSLFVHGYSTMSDTIAEAPYSNHGDIIYLDVNPMGLEVYNENDYYEPDLSATLNAITHEFTRMVMMHNKPDQEDWIIEGVSFMLQKKAVGNVKFFGESTEPVITPKNQLTYIATGIQSLKGRRDKYNAYLFMTYLKEKYSADGTGWDIIQTVTQSDAIGMDAIRDALSYLGYSKTVGEVFADYGLACYLDLAQEDGLYAGVYSFDSFDFQTPPSGKGSALLRWDTAAGNGAPYSFKEIAPWSYNWLLSVGYTYNLMGYIIERSPDLSPDDTLFFGGLHDVAFKTKKLMLKNGFLYPMNPDYEVADFMFDDETGYGTLPVTTNPLFAFKDTLDNAAEGVQLMVLMVAKTAADFSAETDFIISNMHINSPAPTNVTALPSLDHIQIQWNAPPAIGLATLESYQVLRKDQGAMEFNLLEYGLTPLQYDDFTVEPEHNYEYVVLGEYSDGTTGDTSNVVESSLLGEMDIGFRTAITNYGSIGDPNSPATRRPSCEFPAYSFNNYLYDGGLWVGAELNGVPEVTTYFYNPHTEWQPCVNEGNTRPDRDFYILTDPDPVEVCFDDIMPYPESEHTPLGIRVHARYELSPAVTNPETDELETAPWGTISYSIINTGLRGDLTGVYIGLWMDFDVSFLDDSEPHIDDLVDFDEDLNLSYMYDGDHPGSSEDDTGENGLSAGYVGIALLTSPDNTVASHAWWNWESDPLDTDEAKYQYMSATHQTMQGYQYLPNPLELGFPPFDYRFLQTIGPFDLAGLDTIKVEYILAFGNDHDDLRHNVATAKGIVLGTEQEVVNPLPEKFMLYPNYPNPFNPVTTIRFDLPEDADVNLVIYDLLGRQVRWLVKGRRNAGRNAVRWDSRNDAGKKVSTGIYLYRIQAGDFIQTRKMILLK